MNVKLVRQTLRLVFFLCLFIPLLTFLPSSLAAPAAAHTVTTTADSGPGSLRLAIADSAGGDVINFDPSLAGQTIHLQSTLVIDKALTIDGSDRNITISGDSDADGDGDVRVIFVDFHASIILKSLTIDRGFAEGSGGGLVTYSDQDHAFIVDSTFSNNTATGSGGAVWAGDLRVERSTFFNNESGERGGAVNGRALYINNSTFYGNKALCGGAIASPPHVYTSSFMYVLYSTLSHNAASNAGCGTGIQREPDVGFFVENSIIANGIGPGPECSLSSEYTHNNFVEDGTCGAVLTGDPLLGDLQDNGGPTFTMAPKLNSPVIDAAFDDPQTFPQQFCPDIDQRGFARPQEFVGETIPGCDIGSYEVTELLQNGSFNQGLEHWQKAPSHSWTAIRSSGGDYYLTAWPWNGYTIFQDGLNIEEGNEYRGCIDHFASTSNSYAVNLQLLSPTGVNLGLDSPLIKGDQCFEFRSTGSTTNGRLVLLFSQFKTSGTQLNFDDIRLYSAKPADKGVIIIKKEADPADNTPFYFSGDLGSFTLQYPSNMSNSFENLDPGQYRVREDTLPAGWQLTDLTCDPQSSSTINNGEALITLNGGDQVTCTFKNFHDSGGGGEENLVRNGTFDEGLAYWQYDPTHKWVIAQTYAGDTYMVTWPWKDYIVYQSNISLINGKEYEACIDFTPKTTYSYAVYLQLRSAAGSTLGLNKQLTPGQQCATFKATATTADARITLLFKNITVGGTRLEFDDISLRALGSPPPPEKGAITIKKNASPADNTLFNFSGDLGSFTLQDPAVKSKTVADLDPGQYLVREDALPASWSFSGISCDPASAAAISGREVTINLAAGAAVTCTFSNTGAPIGGEEILLNGGFDERLANWSWNPSHTWVSVKKDGTDVYVKAWPWNGYAFFQQGFALVGGQTYEACLDVLEKTDDKTSISLEILASNTTQVTLNQQLPGGIGRKCVSFTAPESASNAVFNVRFWGLTSPGTSFSFDDVSLKEQ